MKQHQQVLLAWAKAGGVQAHAAEALQLPISTFKDRLTEARRWSKTTPAQAWLRKNNIDINKVTKPDIITLDLQRQVKELQVALRKQEEEAVTTEQVRQFYLELSAQSARVPDTPIKSAKITEHGVPTLMLSDLHWGENVNPAEIFYSNKYDSSIAKERMRRVIDTTIYLLMDKLKSTTNNPFPGIVVILGGDLVSGTIHPELEITNDLGPMEMILDCADNLSAAIRKLQKAFGYVWVVGVPGNHGRVTKKSYAKLNAVHNCDWIIEQMIERFMTDLKGYVTFHTPPARDITFAIEGHRYRLTHGDQFRGGDGIIGPLGPIARGDNRKRSAAMSLPGDTEEYDTLVLGHFHQLHMLHNRIINGSLKGYDEYAMSSNFGWEPAQQALWITHRDYGPNHYMPVFAQDPKPEVSGKPPMLWYQGARPDSQDDGVQEWINS